MAVSLLLALSISLLRFNSFQVGANSDDAHYIVLAEALATGQGFNLVSFPNAPHESLLPPGWPLLLSPLAAISADNFILLKLLSLLFNLGSILSAYHLFGSRLNSPYLEMSLTVFAIHPTIVGISGTVMSEPAYLFFSLLTLNLFEKWIQHSKGPLNRFFLPLVLAAIGSELIRTVGLSLLISILFYLTVTRRVRHFVLLTVAFAVGLLPQTLLNCQAGGSVISAGYEQYVFANAIPFQKLTQMATNLEMYLQGTVSTLLFPAFGPNMSALFSQVGLGWVSFLLNVVLLLVLAIGLILSIRTVKTSDVYGLVYFGAVLAVWHPAIDSSRSRYLIPLVPFLLTYFLQGINWLSSFVTRNAKYRMRLVTLIVGGIGILFLVRNLQDIVNPIRNRITDLSVGASWIDEHAPQNALVMTPDPIPRYLYTHRQTVDYTSALDATTILNEIERQGIDYIITSPSLQTPRTTELDDYTLQHLLPVLRANPERFIVVYENQEHNVSVYQVQKSFGWAVVPGPATCSVKSASAQNALPPHKER